MKAKQFLLIGALLSTSLLWGQPTSAKDIVKVQLKPSLNAFPTDKPLNLALEIDILPPWHIYGKPGEDLFVIPTKVLIDSISPGFELDDWEYPEAEKLAVAGEKQPSHVYTGRVVLRNRVRLEEPKVKSFYIRGRVHYQACDAVSCLVPADAPFELTLPVAGAGKVAKQVNKDLFEGAETPKKVQTEAEPVSGEASKVNQLLSQKGLILSLGFIFLLGLALNLTPCVYPLIPITISYFGGSGAGKGKTAWSALAYVLGISVTYSALGVAAALTGKLFGQLLTIPWVLIGLALLMVALALSMFGLYEFRLPAGLMTAAGKTRSGVLGSLFMGLTMGIIAAPCIGPFVVGLLAYVAQTHNPYLGFLLFFVMSLGLGAPYFFLALFSSRIQSLPKSGMWMVGVRNLFGVILLGMAVYFIMPLLGDWGGKALAIYLILGGAYLIMFERHSDSVTGYRLFKQLLAIGVIIYATWLLVPRTIAGDQIDWKRPQNLTALEELMDGSRPLILDFYADWCIPCREMDAITFSDQRVIRRSQAFTMVKIDLTQEKGAFEKMIRRKFDIKGVPTYVFLLPGGKEVEHLRLTGFEDPEPFLKRMEAALKAQE